MKKLLIILGLALPAAATAEPAAIVMPMFMYMGPSLFQLPSLAPNALPAGTVEKIGTLTKIEPQIPAAQSLKALLDLNPYRPGQEGYLAWASHPADVWVSSRAEVAARESGNDRYTPDTFLLARKIDDGSELFTAELQAESDWYAKTVTVKSKPALSGILAKARRIMSTPVRGTMLEPNTIAYGATTVYEYTGGTLITITDVVARVNDKKVQIAAGVIGKNGSPADAAAKSLKLVEYVIKN